MNDVGAMASDLNTRNGKPALVTFQTVAKHLKKESEEAGRYIARDVDMVTVRQLGAADSVVFKVDTWLAQNKLDVEGGRLDAAHAKAYEESYRRWKQGQEMPVHGTPIKSWPVVTPAQVSLLVDIGIRTVEDLAALNDEGLRKIGMGAVDLKNKAKAWMLAAGDKGKLTQDMTALQRDNEQLQQTVTTLTKKLDALQAEMKAEKKATKGRKRVEESIEADDLIEA